MTILTDKSSVESAQKEVSDTEGITVDTADTAEIAREKLLTWRDRVFGKDSVAPFGFVIFIGHGENRRERVFARDYLLVPNDSTSTGIGIQDVAEQFNKLPVVFIADMCRVEVAGEPAPVEAEAGGHPLQVSNSAKNQALLPKNRTRTFDRRLKDEIGPVLTMWAAQPGRIAHDSGDFTTSLAKGLKWSKHSFIARDVRTGNRNISSAAHSPLEGPLDLSLFTWFTSAALAVHNSHNQQPSLSEGLIDPMMICASRRVGYLHMLPATSLLTRWREFADTDLKATETARGVEFQRPIGTEDKSTFAVSFFEDSPLEWKGRSLVIEAFAEAPAHPALGFIQCYWAPGDNSVKESVLRSDWNKILYPVPIGIPTRFVLPLEGDDSQHFTSLAIGTPTSEVNSQWPIGSRIVVSKMYLIDSVSGATVLNPAIKKGDIEIDLLSSWWPIEVKSNDDDTKNISTVDYLQKKEKVRVLHLNFTGGKPGEVSGRGGSVFKPPYVDFERAQLRITLSSIKKASDSKDKPVIEVVVQDDFQNLLTHEETLKSGAMTLTLDFEKSGIAERINIFATNIDSMDIDDISIVPKTPSKKRPK